MNPDARIKLSWSLLRYAYGIVILLVGLDKIFGTDFIVQWPKYISPFALSILPVSVPAFLLVIGVIEVAVAVMMLTRFPRIAGYLSIAWLLIIAVNLLLGGFIDIAVRDILLAIGAYVSVQLSIALEEKHAITQTA